MLESVIPKQQQYRLVLVDTWWYWVSMEWYWLIYDTGLIEGGTVHYMMVLGQYRSVLVDTWWYWVSMEWYWLIYDGTGSVEGGSGWYLVVLGQ